MKLLRRDPAERFQSARELEETLRRLATDRDAVVAAPAATGVPEEAAAPQPPRPRPTVARPAAKRTGGGRLVALGLVAVLLAAGAYHVQPWGRTMDLSTLSASARSGSVLRAWLDDGGIGGYLALGPLVSPFFVGVSEADLPEVVGTLRESGVFVDTSWEVRRLRGLAREAQARSRYYGVDGGDVRTYAQRLAVLQPQSREAESLLLKVGERLAWDADAAREDGAASRAQTLIQQCLELVPDHPRCLAAALGS
jgi:hypothetical protein